VTVKVEILYFDGCPSHEPLSASVRRLLTETGVDADMELRRVESVAGAEAARFLGSPTVRVDGVDVDPGAAAREDFGLKCRLYRSADGARGTPPEEWIRAALTRAGA